MVGYFRAESGVGEVARLLVATLREAGIPHAVLPWEQTISRQEHPFSLEQDAGAIFDVNVICINADELPHFVRDAGAALLAGRYNVGVWAWEVDRLPDEMAKSARLLDEIWGISHYATRAIAPFVDRPVRPFLLPFRRRRQDVSTMQTLASPTAFSSCLRSTSTASSSARTRWA